MRRRSTRYRPLPNEVVILIPAAGNATRMRGGDKLLERVEGAAQLARVTRAALASGALVIVTLGVAHDARAAVLPDHASIVVLRIPDAAEGMAASLRAGAARAGEAKGLMVLPADMPDLETADIQKVIAHFICASEQPCRAAAADGRPGHPVILPRRLFPAIAALHGDTGARAVLAGEHPGLVPLPGQRATTDLDTPEDWTRWRAGRMAPDAWTGCKSR